MTPRSAAGRPAVVDTGPPLLFARFLRVGAFFHAVISRDASPGAIQRPRAILVPQGAKLTQIKAAAPGAA